MPYLGILVDHEREIAMAKKKQQQKSTKKVKKAGGRKAGRGGRQIEGGLPEAGRTGRGNSIQGERQDAKGGPQDANQGGASRGGSRIEPSHQRRQQRMDRA